MSIYNQVNNPVLRRSVEPELRAAVAVVDELDVGASAAHTERHLERVEHRVGAHVRGEVPADDRQPALSARLELLHAPTCRCRMGS
jgi:hypothetical protein